ncbi:unnamed protein product [Didymodactylos carnosus]|uniref:Tetratricopeptide repeat protein n=1 Tax=Didymodactylos carnosus TaxID=1234261 RepID=A0A814MGS8_9BILA|nr:unnamed protein product [Didymodactylos carnosus]CAF3845411.1 unnamed protein product [Didymodactylos carnosus]
MSKAANTKKKQQWNAGSVIPRKPINFFGENQRRTSSTSVSIALSSPSINKTFAGQQKSVLPSISGAQLPVPSSAFHDEDDNDESFLPPKIFDGSKSSINDLSQASSSYIWLRRIKEIFLQMGKNKKTDDEDPFVNYDMEIARDDMLKTFKQYIENQRPDTTAKDYEQKIKKWNVEKLYAETFKMSYKRNTFDQDEKQVQLNVSTNQSGGDRLNFENAIWWYSCNEASIYSQINNMLRTENFELLMSYRYYIIDLCQMIEHAYNRQQQSDTNIKLYRSEKIDSGKLIEMTEKVGKFKNQLISMNGFISTTINEDIATGGYGQKESKRPNVSPVLYEITIEPKKPGEKCPCAFTNIEQISFHPEEKEVLFSIGSIFVVENINNDFKTQNGKSYEYTRIRLKQTEYNETIVNEMKSKVKRSSQSELSALLIEYLIYLGEYRAAKRYLNSLFKNVSVIKDDSSLPLFYNSMGIIYTQQGLYGDAIRCYKQALDHQIRLQYSNSNRLAQIYNNIGYVYLQMEHNEEALENIKKAERLQLRELKSIRQHLPSIYSNMGQVYYSMGQAYYDDADEQFKKAENMYEQHTYGTYSTFGAL